MHKRRQYLEALRTQLTDSTLFAGVWIQRTGPARAAYPSVTLYADQETVETIGVHAPARPQQRILTVSVMAWIRGTANDERPDQEMDSAAESIETTLTVPAGADDLMLIATDFAVDEEEPEIHAVTLTYQLSYCTDEYAPGV